MTDRSDASIDDILTFWFAGTIDDPHGVGARMPFWFQGDDSRDAGIVSSFAGLVQSARNGDLDAWITTPRGQLALIILLDQLPRNIHRGTADAFTSDEAALTICMQGITSGDDRKLGPAERMFYYMPLQHAESVEAQEYAVQVFDALAETVAPDLTEVFAGCADFARRHHDIVAQFGRFPHRNQILGRQSTPEEIAYLESGGDTFGQG